MNKLKVVLFQPYIDNAGGAYKVLLKLSEFLHKSSITVKWIIPKRPPSVMMKEIKNVSDDIVILVPNNVLLGGNRNANLFTITNSFLSAVIYSYKILRVLKLECNGNCALIINGLKGIFMLIPLFIIRRKFKIIYYNHGNALSVKNITKGYLQIISKCLDRFASKRAWRTVFVCKYSQRANNDPKNSIVIYNPIDFEMNYKALGKKYKRKDIIIGTLANIYPVKGIVDLVHAFIYFKNNFSASKLLIAGKIVDKSYFKELKTIIKRHGLENSVSFVGFVDPKVFLTELDLFVLSSLHETFPVSILESIANGVIVVSTNVGGVSEIIIDGKTGFLTKPGDPETLYKAMKKAIELNDEQRKSMLENAMNRIKLMCSEDIFKEKWKQIIDSLDVDQKNEYLSKN